MKHSRVLATLLSAYALPLACSADSSDPPPVAGPGGAATPANGGGAGAPADPSMMATGGSGPAPGTTPAGMEGQAGVPLTPGTGGTSTAGMNPAVPNAGGASGTNAAGAGGTGDVPPPELDLEELVGELDGHLFVVPCGDTPATDDCQGAGWTSTFQDPGTNHACVGSPLRLDARIDFPIGGEPGALYDVTMHFYGIMEPRQYANVTRDAAPSRPTSEPGELTPFATLQPGATSYLSGDNNYNTYELRVLNQDAQEVAAYFLNADTTTGHYTFGIDYEKTIRLIGGGTLRLQIVDANCRQIKNCGSGGIPCAAKAREIDISAADPQPPANALQQPALGRDREHSGQWFLLDVLGFTPAQ